MDFAPHGDKAPLLDFAPHGGKAPVNPRFATCIDFAPLFLKVDYHKRTNFFIYLSFLISSI